MRRLQSARSSYPSKLIACIGDSQTLSVNKAVLPHEYYPHLLQTSLRTLGCDVTARNFGVSGDTTAQGLARVSCMDYYGAPDLAIVALGINDSAGQEATLQSNLEGILDYLTAAGCTRNIILNIPYQNWSAGNYDTVSTPYAANAARRAAQAAAATAKGAVLCDLYTYLRALIVATTETQGSYSWHYADQDVHLNVLGQSYCAAALLATVQAQTGWVSALTVSQ